MADIQKAAPQTSLVTLKAIMQKYAPDIQQLIPKHVTAERIVLVAQAALTRNPDIMNCDPRTILSCIIQASIMGLELHTALHHASIVPFWNSKAGFYEATLMIEYPGLIELVMRGGDTSFVEAQPVYSADFLDVQYGSDPHLIHKPEIRAERGQLIGAYAYAKLKNGDTKFHVMSKADIEKRRSVSKAKDSGPWVDWTAEQYAKTPLRHLTKQLRKTSELSIALAHEDRFDQDIHSVVESGEGLSLDFLSMNIDAKTLEAKEDLKKRLEEKNQPAQQQPQPPTSATPQGGQSSAGMEETKRRIAEAAADNPPASAQTTTPPPSSDKRGRKTSTAATPELAAQTLPLQEDRTSLAAPLADQDPDLASLYAQEQSHPAPDPTQTVPKLDAMDAQITESECRQLLELVKAKKIDGRTIREQLNLLHQAGKTEGGTNLMRNLTKRNAAKLTEWINSK